MLEAIIGRNGGEIGGSVERGGSTPLSPRRSSNPSDCQPSPSVRDRLTARRIQGVVAALARQSMSCARTSVTPDSLSKASSACRSASVWGAVRTASCM